MAIKRGIIITSFGDRRKQLDGILYNIRRFTDLPIVLVTDFIENSDIEKIGKDKGIISEIINGKWLDHYRYGIRNSNYFKVKYALSYHFDVSLCLDDDMRIVNKQFEEGFNLAEKFGICVPMNPRIYVGLNAIGEDTTPEDRLELDEFETMTAVNMSPMYVDRRKTSVKYFLKSLMENLLEKPCRGTLAFSKTMIETGFTPLILPETYCVGRNNAEFWRDYSFMYREKKFDVKPIMLHFGQPKVREVFLDIYPYLLREDKQ